MSLHPFGYFQQPLQKLTAEQEEMVNAILRVKRAPICVVCGNDKDPGRWFCKTCYFCLVPNLRKAIWSCQAQSNLELLDCYLQSIDALIRSKRFFPRQKMPATHQEIIEQTNFGVALTNYLAGGRA